MGAGALHFLISPVYLRIMPPYLPAPLILVYISGAAEMLGGLGLLIASTRRAAAWGLIALLIAVWPANLYMAMAHPLAAGSMVYTWALWLRLPLQLPLIYWAWLYARRRQD